MTGFKYTKAKRENIWTMVGFAGASQSGKTRSAMMIAQALGRSIDDRPFAMVDSENDRGLMYDDEFDFEHHSIKSPFGPDKYLQKAQELAQRGFPCVLIDSMSHEWAGVGGVIDMADKDRAKPPGNWARPKTAHKRMMDGFLQIPAHVVFCLRAHEKIKIEKAWIDGKEKTVVIPQGWMPVCEKSFMFEMTVSFTLLPDEPGMLDFSRPHKLPDVLKPIFLDGSRVTQEMGAALADWAKGGVAAHPDTDLWRDARNAANLGTVKLRDFSQQLSPDQSVRLRPIGRELNDTARATDQSLAAGFAPGTAAPTAAAASADDYEERYDEDTEPDEGGPLDNESPDAGASGDASPDQAEAHHDPQTGEFRL